MNARRDGSSSRLGLAMLSLLIGAVARARRPRVHHRVPFWFRWPWLAIIKWPYVGLLIYVVVYFTQLADSVPGTLKPLRPERVIGVDDARGHVPASSCAKTGHVYIDRSKTTVWLLLVRRRGGQLHSDCRGGPERRWAGSSKYIKIIVFYPARGADHQYQGQRLRGFRVVVHRSAWCTSRSTVS